MLIILPGAAITGINPAVTINDEQVIDPFNISAVLIESPLPELYPMSGCAPWLMPSAGIYIKTVMQWIIPYIETVSSFPYFRS